VLLKGGHLSGAPADLLLANGKERWFKAARIDASKRGTGCRLASAVAANLALGKSIEASVERGIGWLRRWLAAP
jgi:hydroxymethylpyrimidine/phosphomethylpyrimidine kinase